MEHFYRFLTIVLCLTISLVTIHAMRTPQQIVKTSVPVACFTPEMAKKLNAATALKWSATIAYDSVERTGNVESYQCFFAFPKTSVVCSPRDTASRKNTQACPNFPSLLGNKRLCYFIDSKYHPLVKVIQQTPRQSYKNFDGVIVKSIQEAKKVLGKK